MKAPIRAGAGRSRPQRLPALARRSIPVADPSPVQLPLALTWRTPFDRVVATQRDPDPVVVPFTRREVAA